MATSRYLVLEMEILPLLNLIKGTGTMFLFPGQREIPNKEANILQRSKIHYKLLLRFFSININMLVDRTQAQHKKFMIE